MLNKAVASDHKHSDNTYFSFRASSLETERTTGNSWAKTFFKGRLLFAWFYCVSGLLRVSKINNIHVVEIEWT
jgi:hypothetical protein